MFKNRGWMVAALALALLVPAIASAKKPKVDESTREAILGALDDEWRSEALYRSIIAQIGEVKPFTNVVDAEVRHASHVEELMGTLGMKVPDNPWQDNEFEELPETLADACTMAVKTELDNIALYDSFLQTVSDTPTRELFERLRGAGGGRGEGPGHGQGGGGGAGHNCADCRH